MIKWLRRPRTFGSASTKETRLLDEYNLLTARDPAKDSEVLELVVGKEWRNIPTRSAMDIVSTRFCVQPRDYADEEVKDTLSLLLELGNRMLPEQKRFLMKFDHLPLSLTSEEPWMKGDELEALVKSDSNTLYDGKTRYFLTVNGIMQASAQAGGEQVTPEQEKRPLKIHPALIIGLLLLAGLIIALFI